MSKGQSIASVAVILCVILIAVLFATKPNDDYNSLYVASYIPGLWDGNIVLVNPTSDSLSNLNMTIQVDSSEIIVPSLRLWDSNYTLNPPNSFMQNVYMNTDMINFSTPITLISIEPNKNETINLSFPSSDTFRFSSHNLTIFISQNTFGDIINGQSLTIPQTEAYLQVVSYSSIVSDYDTYHEYFNRTLNEYMIVNDNPNFLQRYFNISWEIGSANHKMMSRMNLLGETYFNVTVYNNSTFPVYSVTFVGQQEHYFRDGRALDDYVMQPNETYVFPVGGGKLPNCAYVTGYVTNSTLQISHPNSTPSPTL